MSQGRRMEQPIEQVADTSKDQHQSYEREREATGLGTVPAANPSHECTVRIIDSLHPREQELFPIVMVPPGETPRVMAITLFDIEVLKKLNLVHN